LQIHHITMTTWPTELPPLLALLHQLDCCEAVNEDEVYDDEALGMDFEPYPAFFPAEENADWFRAWTGNPEVDGAQFRVFGQDGSGGYAALWLTQPGRPLEEQPVVFLGSEGEVGVIALNLDEYLWLLAAGVGPHEAVEGPDMPPRPQAQFAEFAQQHGHTPPLSAPQVLARAQAAYPSFEADILALCR
jgi:hypothetical protein